MSTKADKLAALARDSGATEAERQRAQEALERLRAASAPPAPGSPEWRAAQLRHQTIVAQAVSRLGDPRLTPAEISIVRGFGRGIGHPWEPAAEDLRRIHAKLFEDESEAKLLPKSGDEPWQAV